jgi:hypothetical protein
LDRTFGDPINIFTLGLVIVGAIQAGLFWWQYDLIRESLADAKISANAARKAADVAEQALTVLERPHLFIEEPKIIRTVIQGQGLRQEFRRELRYEFTNYGKTPAIVRWMEATIRIGESTNFWQEIFNGRVIFSAAQHKAIVPLHSYPIQEEAAPGVIGQTAILTISVTYWDVFDWIHVDEFKFFRMGDRFVPIAGNENNRRNTKKLREGEEWTAIWSRQLLSDPPS